MRGSVSQEGMVHTVASKEKHTSITEMKLEEHERKNVNIQYLSPGRDGTSTKKKESNMIVSVSLSSFHQALFCGLK